MSREPIDEERLEQIAAEESERSWVNKAEQTVPAAAKVISKRELRGD